MKINNKFIKQPLSFLFLIAIFFSSQLIGLQIWEEYPEVKDKRNYKESNGGKGVPPQGRILEESTKTLFIPGPRIINHDEEVPSWNYIVSMNCRRGDRSVKEILTDVASQLLPSEERYRLGIILGINEKVGVDHPLDYDPTWEVILGGEEVREDISQYNIPILITYYQWTSFREDPNNKFLSASGVRRQMMGKLSQLRTQRQKDVAIQKLRSVDARHQFPFGKAREYLLGTQDAINLIASLDSPQSGVYIHIQDSDYICLREELKFSDLEAPTKQHVMPANDNYLFKKYDALIDGFKTCSNHLPVVVGGAHVYSPQEEMSTYLRERQLSKLDSDVSKHWTRFGSEMGNRLKHIIGIQQPYGLYFHEPNTLILSPHSARRLLQSEKESGWKDIYKNLAAGFKFGIDSEVQDFTRMVFNGASDSLCRSGMVFSSNTILSTSMKRGKKPFTIECEGTFDEQTQKFKGSTSKNLTKLRGMSQEVIKPNQWMSNVTTSFKLHRLTDTRKVVSNLLNLFDPLGKLDPGNPASFTYYLLNYEEYLLQSQLQILEVCRTLTTNYNKLNQGFAVAKAMISIAWECGQVIRLMLLDNLMPPQGTKIPSNHIGGEVRTFLSQRFSFQTIHTGGFSLNPFVEFLLSYRAPTKPIPIKIIISNDNQGVPKIALPKIQTVQPPHLQEVYSEENFSYLLAMLKEKVVAGQLTYGQVTSWAGYSGLNGARDFASMASPRARAKQKRWENLIEGLKENSLFDSFFRNQISRAISA